MHSSQTIDLMVIISGELWAYQEHTSKAILLKQGDTLIQRGTSHAWENKSDAPCRFAVVLLGATAR
jgi:quercetin dioxygenase-like cupin family protein